MRYLLGSLSDSTSSETGHQLNVHVPEDVQPTARLSAILQQLLHVVPYRVYGACLSRNQQSQIQTGPPATEGCSNYKRLEWGPKW
jgi:hypothetical protein